MKTVLCVGLGGFVGALSRYLLLNLFNLFARTPSAVGIMLVNIIGCLLMGMIIGMQQRGIASDPLLNVLFITGFLGSLTTFSSFANESFLLTQHSGIASALSYMLLQNSLAMAAIYLGISLTARGLALLH